MADMQTLMSMVQRLEGQGIDVVALLQSAAMGVGGAAGSLGAAGAGAVSNNEFMGRTMPPYEPFEGPGPGAVIDMDRMPMRRGGSTSDVEFEMLQRMLRGMPPSSTPSMPDPRSNASGILQLLGGMR